MNSRLYLQGYATIAIVGLGCAILPCTWVHVLIGGAVVVLLFRNGDLIHIPTENSTTRQSQFGQMGGRRFAARA